MNSTTNTPGFAQEHPQAMDSSSMGIPVGISAPASSDPRFSSANGSLYPFVPEVGGALMTLLWPWRNITSATRGPREIDLLYEKPLPRDTNIRLSDLTAVLGVPTSVLERFRHTAINIIDEMQRRVVDATEGMVYYITDRRFSSGRTLVVCFNDERVEEDAEIVPAVEGNEEGDIIIPSGPYAGRVSSGMRLLSDCRCYREFNVSSKDGKEFFTQIVVPRIVREFAGDADIWTMLNCPEMIRCVPEGNEWLITIHKSVMHHLFRYTLLYFRKEKGKMTREYNSYEWKESSNNSHTRKRLVRSGLGLRLEMDMAAMSGESQAMGQQLACYAGEVAMLTAQLEQQRAIIKEMNDQLANVLSLVMS